jgi:ElaB/YqjD/DUF883 family membrane-anchored ribosome-binding protein
MTRRQMPTETAVARDKLAADLRAVIDDTEELIKATAGQAGEKVQAARARAEETLETAKARLTEIGEEGMERAKAAAKATDEYVHDNPWQSIGVAAGVGFLIGWVLGRK